MTVGLSCQQQGSLVTAYLDDVLPAGIVVRFEDHLSTCESCRIRLERAREKIAVTGALSADEIDEPMRDRLRAIFRNWQVQSPEAGA